MKSKKTLPCGALAIGVLVALIGIACVVMYVLEAVVARAGEVDQSLLFWYLPFFLIGLGGTAVGLGIGVWGTIRLRKIRREDNELEIDN